MVWLMLAARAWADDTPATADDEETTAPAATGDDVVPLPVAGFAIRPVGGPAAVTLDTLFIVGGTGGTQIATVAARAPRGDWQFGAAVPLAAYRAPSSHEVGVGNLGADLWHRGRRVDWGLEGRLALGAPAWTWGYAAPDVWPGTGLAVAVQSSQEAGPVTLLGRAAFGIYGTPDVPPFPGTYGRLDGAFAVDWSPVARAGLVGELAWAGWDPTPVDATLGLRALPIDGVQLRAAAWMPLSLWAGGGPYGDVTAGFHELGLSASLTLGR